MKEHDLEQNYLYGNFSPERGNFCEIFGLKREFFSPVVGKVTLSIYHHWFENNNTTQQHKFFKVVVRLRRVGDFFRAMINPSKESTLDYNPTIFLRCHSAVKTDEADVRTKVWQCAFEPDSHSSNHRSVGTFATCGGNSVCVIQAKDGVVKTKHYAKDSREDFHALAWTSIFSPIGVVNILAVAGRRSTLHLLHPEKHVCFREHYFKKQRSNSNPVESLIFHPENPSYLIAAFYQGEVVIYDIGKPYPGNYKCEVKVLKTVETRHSAFALTFSQHCNMLLCGTETGIVGWKASTNEIESKRPLNRYDLSFNHHTKFDSTYNETQLVDSVEVIREGKFVASKCANQGCIYIWSLEDALNSMRKANKCKVSPAHVLKWSDTDNYFMNIGISPKEGILACGDDKGKVWVYEIKDFHCSPPYTEYECDKVLDWPVVDEPYIVHRRKLSLDVCDIVVNRVSLSYDARYLVAVTDRNLVCIWQRVLE